MHKKIWTFTGLALFLAVLLLPSAAMAETTIGGGIGITTSPYKSMKMAWDPVPMLAYEGDSFYLRGLTGGYKFFATDVIELSAFVRYDSLHFNASDSGDTALKRLDDRRASASGGVEARLMTQVGTFAANVAVDMLRRSKGLTAEARYSNTWNFGPMGIVPSVGVRLFNDQYGDYYYGVSRKESWRSGLTAYEAGGGAEPYAGVMMTYGFTEQFRLLAGTRLTLLSPHAQHSPMVNKTATVNLTFGLTYSF